MCSEDLQRDIEQQYMFLNAVEVPARLQEAMQKVFAAAHADNSKACFEHLLTMVSNECLADINATAGMSSGGRAYNSAAFRSNIFSNETSFINNMQFAFTKALQCMDLITQFIIANGYGGSKNEVDWMALQKSVLAEVHARGACPSSSSTARAAA